MYNFVLLYLLDFSKTIFVHPILDCVWIVSVNGSVTNILMTDTLTAYQLIKVIMAIGASIIVFCQWLLLTIPLIKTNLQDVVLPPES